MTRHRRIDVETHEDTTHEKETLRSALDALAREEAAIAVPAHLERAVMQAWDDAHADRPDVRQATLRWRGVALVATIVLGCGVWLARDPEGAGPMPPLPDGPAHVYRVPAPPSVPFVDVAEATPPRRRSSRVTAAPAAARIPEAPAMLVLVGTPLTRDEQVHVVRMRIDRKALAGMGLRPLDGDSASTVDVDLLVGEDGVARALRLRM